MCHDYENKENKKHEFKIVQSLGLKYNPQSKTVDMGVVSFEKKIDFSLKVEEAKEFMKGLKQVISEAEADKKKEVESDVETDPENSEAETEY